MDDARSARAADRCVDLGVPYRLHTDTDGVAVIHVGPVACRDQDEADAELDRLEAARVTPC